MEFMSCVLELLFFKNPVNIMVIFEMLISDFGKQGNIYLGLSALSAAF
jgi:hypothetical protein